jgi:hypothetical protein
MRELIYRLSFGCRSRPRRRQGRSRSAQEAGEVPNWRRFELSTLFSDKLKYFEPSNVLLMDTLLEMFNPTEDEENIGAGDGI